MELFKQHYMFLLCFTNQSKKIDFNVEPIVEFSSSSIFTGELYRVFEVLNSFRTSICSSSGGVSRKLYYVGLTSHWNRQNVSRSEIISTFVAGTI